MLDATRELASLLEAWRTDTSVAPYVAEFYSFTDSSGAVIARWTGADASLAYGGNIYAKGPGITRGQITRQVGTQASSLDVTFSMDASVSLNGVPLAAFIAGNGLINAVMTFERAYAPAPGAAIAGTLPKFTGRVMQMRYRRDAGHHRGVELDGPAQCAGAGECLAAAVPACGVRIPAAS